MPKSRAWRLLLAALVVSDCAWMLVALKAAAWFARLPVFGAKGTPDWGFILMVLPVMIAIFLLVGLYQPQNLLGGTWEYGAVFRGATYGVLAIVLVSFVSRRIVSREWIVFSWALGIVLVGSGRFLIRRLAYWFRRHGHLTARTLMVGADAHSVAVAQQLSQRGSGVRIVGFLDDYVPAGSVLANGHRVLGGASSLMQVAAKTHADEAIVVPQALPWETLQTVLTAATASPNGFRVHLPAGFYDLLTTRVGLSERNHVPLLTVKKARFSPAEAAFKSAFDYGMALTMLLICSPVMAAVLFSLKLTGPDILVRRPVIGRYRRPFELLAFPSRGLGRIQFIGKLPGLINVLRGELSIVGPRPIEPRDAAAAAQPLTIKPGLTGSWRQVSDPAEQAVLDLYYIRSYSVWLDLQVLFQRLKARLA